jgi:hypothetical protein
MPYFMRGRTEDVFWARPYMAIFKQFGWNKICILGSADIFGRGLAAKLREVAPTLLLFDQYYSVDGTADIVLGRALTAFRALLADDCRIFVLNLLLTVSQAAMEAAYQLGMLNNHKYQIIGYSDWIESYTKTYNRDAYGLLGAIVWTTPKFPIHAQRFYDMYPSSGSGVNGSIDLQYDTQPIVAHEVIYYDVTVYMVQAIARLLNRNRSQEVTGAILLDELHNMSLAVNDGPFNGPVSGPFIVSATSSLLQPTCHYVYQLLMIIVVDFVAIV